MNLFKYFKYAISAFVLIFLFQNCSEFESINIEQATSSSTRIGDAPIIEPEPVTDNFFQGKSGNQNSALSLHNRGTSTNLKYAPWGIYSYESANNNIIKDNQFFNFKNIVRDYSFVGKAIEHSKNSEITNNEFYITSPSQPYNLGARRTASELESAHVIRGNDMLNSAPKLRTECE